MGKDEPSLLRDNPGVRRKQFPESGDKFVERAIKQGLSASQADLPSTDAVGKGKRERSKATLTDPTRWEQREQIS